MPGLQTAYQLQTAELERADVLRRLREAEGGLGETEQLRRTRANLQSIQAELAGLRTRVRDLELEVRSLTDRITAGEQRLYGGEVRNPKELESLQADLRHLRARRESLEDGILTGLTQIDDCEARLQRAESEAERVQTEWQQHQTRLQATMADLTGQLSRLEERIARLRAALPEPLMELYDETCRKKGGRGIAAIRSGLCEGCRVSVPTSIVQNVRRGDDVVRCSSCGRILCVIE